MINKVGVLATVRPLSQSELVKFGSKVLDEVQANKIFLRAIALHAGETNGPNGNGDYFPWDELLKSYHTFIGKRLDFNHETHRVIGKLLDAYPVEDPETKEKCIELICRYDRGMDAEADKHYDAGKLTKGSMETTCEIAECNVCGKQATIKEEFCIHLDPTGILQEYPAEIENASLNIKVGSKIKAASINKGLTFTGYALVFDPADKGADVTRIATQKKETKEDILSKLSNVVEKLADSVKSLVTPEVKPEAVDQVKARVSKGLLAELLRKTVARELVAHNVPKAEVEDTTKQIVDEIVDSAIASAKKVAEDKSVDEVKKCPECEKPNQFGELCEKCRGECEKKTALLKQAEQLKEFWVVTNPEYSDKEKACVKMTVAEFMKESADSVFRSELGVKLYSDESEARTDLDSRLKKTAPDKEEQVAKIAEVIKVSVKKEASVFISALEMRFTPAEKIEDATWSLHDKKNAVLVFSASLKDIWGDKLTEHAKYATHPTFAHNTIRKISELGFEPVLQGFTKAGAPANFDLAWYKKWGAYPDEGKGGACVPQELLSLRDKELKDVPDKPLNERLASTDKKAVDTIDEVQDGLKNKGNPPAVGKPSIKDQPPADKAGMPHPDKKETIDVNQNRTSEKETKAPTGQPNVKLKQTLETIDKVVNASVEKKASIFDEQETVILGEGIQAYKDKETQRIIVKDKDGVELGNYVDAFCDDMTKVIEFLRECLELNTPEEEKSALPLAPEVPPVTDVPVIPEVPAVAASKDKEEKNDDKKEETVATIVAPTAIAAPTATPAAAPVVPVAPVAPVVPELSEKEKELQGQLVAEQQKRAAAQLELQQKELSVKLAAKAGRCKELVSKMVERGMIIESEDDVQRLQREGKSVIDARSIACKQKVDEQYRRLLALGELELKQFDESVENVRKNASLSDRQKILLHASLLLGNIGQSEAAKADSSVDRDTQVLQQIFNRKKR